MNMRKRRWMLAGPVKVPLLFLLCVCLCSSVATSSEWYSWRGPEQTGVSREKDLPAKWSPEEGASENLIWKMPYGSRSTPLVFGGRVYIINSDGEGVHQQERVMCFDDKDGKVLWQHKFNVFHTDIVS